jgi:hypothetical protein
MNSSIYSADRTTHLRIIAVALVISIAIVGFAASARLAAIGTLQASEPSGQIQKAGVPTLEAMATRSALPRI